MMDAMADMMVHSRDITWHQTRESIILPVRTSEARTVICAPHWSADSFRHLLPRLYPRLLPRSLSHPHPRLLSYHFLYLHLPLRLHTPLHPHLCQRLPPHMRRRCPPPPPPRYQFPIAMSGKWSLRETCACLDVREARPEPGARWTETSVAPRHVDASRDFYFIFSERPTWGGGRCQTLFILFSFPCSADHERDRPPYEVLRNIFLVGN